MKRGHFSEHWSDSNGNPAGGVSSGRGFAISWQNGPLGRPCAGGCTLHDHSGAFANVDFGRREPNGAFVEDVIAAVIGRLEFYQASRFNCIENADALRALKAAAEYLDSRTRNREERAVEGTHAT